MRAELYKDGYGNSLEGELPSCEQQRGLLGVLDVHVEGDHREPQPDTHRAVSGDAFSSGLQN